jgi:integrase
MKQRYHCYRRENGIYYSIDTLTKKRQSLNTNTPEEARRLLNALNEACQQPALNMEIARVYLQHGDQDYAKRTWRQVMDRMGDLKSGSTSLRWKSAVKDSAFDGFRELPLVKTQSEHFLEALKQGTVSTNVFLRRIHNFALDMDWLPRPLIPKRQWPQVVFEAKRAITWVEHQQLLAQEADAEYHAYYEMLWHLGGSQSDIARLNVENVNWEDRTIAYFRMKTDSRVMFHFGDLVVELLKKLPEIGPLFPRLRPLRGTIRATHFHRQCALQGITGVTLHSYRYAWAQRAKEAGYPERFAQEALGHNSVAVHRAYAMKASVKLPSLEEYERKNAPVILAPTPLLVNQAK